MNDDVPEIAVDDTAERMLDRLLVEMAPSDIVVIDLSDSASVRAKELGDQSTGHMGAELCATSDHEPVPSGS